jgi:hypothetical protein
MSPTSGLYCIRYGAEPIPHHTHFNPEDGAKVLLPNVGIPYRLHGVTTPRRPQSKNFTVFNTNDGVRHVSRMENKICIQYFCRKVSSEENTQEI